MQFIRDTKRDVQMYVPIMAPQVGLEPTTLRLTAECSAIELLRNMESGSDLLSRAVTSQVPSAHKGLTSVFGMGTGGSPSPLPPEISQGLRTLKTAHPAFQHLALFNQSRFSVLSYALLRWPLLRFSRSSFQLLLRSSPRPISIIKLQTLLLFHR